MMKKLIKRFCAAFLALGLIAMNTLPVLASGFDSSVKEGVAAIATYIEIADEQGIYSSGTCFFVGDLNKNAEYLVTNYHVIADYYENGEGRTIDYSPGDGYTYPLRLSMRVYYDQDSYDEAYVVECDAKKDLALLRLDSPTNRRRTLPILAPTEDMVGSTVYAVGYPGTADNPYYAPVSTWGIGDMTVTQGAVSRLLTTKGTGVKAIQTDVQIQHGNSGGPMVNTKGQVIGVNSGAYIQADGIEIENVNYAIDVNELIPILDRNGVPHPSGGGSFPIIAVIAAAGIIFIIVIVLVLVLVSSKNKKSRTPAAGPVRQGAVGGANGANAAAANAANAAQGIPAVRSLSVQHNGQRVSLKDRQIMVGRDRESCAIVFKEGTPGVSGRHCNIAYDSASGDFLVTDLKSTYGTFLANGQKLEAGQAYRLRPGDSFYLGEADNALRVELA